MPKDNIAPYAQVGSGSDRELVASGRLATRLHAELTHATGRLARLGDAVVIFGSARLDQGSAEFELTVEMSRQIAVAGNDIITGGGPGVMLAGNRGAQLGGSTSVGLNLNLEHENDGGGNGAQDIVLRFEDFAMRNEVFIRYGNVALVIMPGGYGTAYELFMALTHIQCKKADKRPIILVEDDPERLFWDWVPAMCQSMRRRGFISDGDDQLYRVVAVGDVPALVQSFKK